MKRHKLLPVFALALPLAACGGSPDQLAKDLQAAFEDGDMDRAMALAHIEDSPARLHSLYLREVVDCASATTTCSVSLGSIDETFKQRLEKAAEQGLEIPFEPEGLVLVESQSPDSKGRMSMPYARTDAGYRVISLQYSEATLAESRAASLEQLAEKLLVDGIYDSELGERRYDWKEGATALPPDGGEAGAALRAQTAAMAAAIDANDPEAAIRAGGRLEEMIYGAKDHAGNEVPLRLRQLKLQANGIRELREVQIKGGWQRGNDALLLIEAKDGKGWIERGAIFMSFDGERWGLAGRETVSFPN